MNTQEIIQQCRKGDQVAFSQLYDTFSEKQFSVAFRILSDEDDAADIVQESFLSVWKNLDRYDPDRAFSSWITRITVNLCYDLLRKKKKLQNNERDEHILKQLMSDESGPEEKLTNMENLELIRNLTDELSPKQKIVFVLSEIEEYSHDEVAEITGMKKNSIKSNLNHARRKIANKLLQYQK